MSLFSKVFVILALLVAALGCDVTQKSGSQSVISKNEVISDVSACFGFTYAMQTAHIAVNASEDCDVYLCKWGAAVLKLSYVIKAKSNELVTLDASLGMGGINANLTMCKTGNDKVLFNEYRIEFDS